MLYGVKWKSSFRKPRTIKCAMVRSHSLLVHDGGLTALTLSAGDPLPCHKSLNIRAVSRLSTELALETIVRRSRADDVMSCFCIETENNAVLIIDMNSFNISCQVPFIIRVHIKNGKTMTSLNFFNFSIKIKHIVSISLSNMYLITS